MLIVVMSSMIPFAYMSCTLKIRLLTRICVPNLAPAMRLMRDIALFHA
jgi:hypothetical protein